LRVKIIALGSAALAIAVFCGWLHSMTMRLLLPPLPEQKTLTPPPQFRPLNYHIDTAMRNGAIGIVNQEHFAWNDVHVEIADGHESFQCPAVPTVESGHTLIIEGRLCRSSSGHMPTHVCVVRVAAKQGRITNGLEPCAPVQ
jgi:hypothetical protein